MRKILLLLAISFWFHGIQLFAQCTSTTVYPYNTMQTTATIVLNSTTTGGTYYIEYGPAGFTPGTAATAGVGGILVTIPTNQNYVNLTGLTANTAYDVYCRKNCSGSWSTNSTARRVNTAYDCSVAPTIGCGVMNSYPHPYGEGAWYSMCYQTIPNADGSGTERIYSFTPTVSGMHMVYVPANSDVTTFSYKPASQACDNLGWLCLGTTNNNNHLPGQYPFGPLTAGVQYWFRTDTEFINAYDTAVFRIECPYCVTPSAIATSNITTNTATVSFTSSGPNNYVEYGPKGFVPGNGFSAGTGGTIVNAGGFSSVTLSGLSLSTQYDVYVRRNCGSGNFSPNSQVHTFVTKNCPIYSTPYSWNNTIYFVHDQWPGEYDYLGTCNTLTNGTEQVKTFTAWYTGNLEMRLYSNQFLYGGGTFFSALVSQNCAIGGQPCQYPIFPPANANGLFYSIPVVAGTNYEIIVDVDTLFYPTGTSMTVELYCPQPQEVSVSNLQPNSVEVNWNCSGSTGHVPCQSTPLIEYGLAGFVPGTGAAAGTGGTLLTATSSPFTISGLLPFTSYDLYMRAPCGSFYSTNTTKITFKTGKDCSLAQVLNCGDYTTLSLPYQNIPGAWNSTACSNNYNQAGETIWRFTPSQTGVYSIYVYKLTGSANYSTPANFYVKSAALGCNEFSWSCVGTVSGTPSTFAPVALSLGTLTAGTTYLIMGDGAQPLYNTYTYSFRLDCPNYCPPTVITSVSTNASSATIASLCPGCSGTSYLEYGVAGFTPGTGSSPGVGGTLITAPSASQVINGLVSGTTYDAYIRNDCGGSIGFSSNSAKATFTPCFTTASSITSTPSTAICAGTSVKLKQVGGVLPPGGQFKWYAGSCGSVLVGTGDSIIVTPGITTTYRLRIESSCGNSLCTPAFTVTVNAVNASITASGPLSFCQGGSVTLQASTGTGYTWQWYKNGTALSGATSSFVSVNNSGNYTVQVTGSTGCTAISSPVNVTVNPIPTVSFSGLATTYSDIDPPVTLTGIPSGGTFSGPGISGNQFYPSVVGAGGPYTIVYSYTDGNGCSNTSSGTTSVTGCVSPPTQPGTISYSGNPNACPGETKTYMISAVSGANTYNWTVPSGATITSGQGTISIQVSFGSGFVAAGNVTVTASNNCGTSAPALRSVGLNTPGMPGVISGPAQGLCNASGVSYSVASVSGITYNWSFSGSGASVASGQGTPAISANFSSGFSTSTLSVTSTNGCGTSSARTLALSAIPSTPLSITGPTAVCSGQQGVPYSITPLYGAATYTWAGPSKSKFVVGTTVSPNNTITTSSSSVNVNYGNKTGILKVRGNNACGSGAYQSISITFNCRESASGYFTDLSEVKISPNPAAEVITVSFEASSDFDIEVLNLLGEKVLFASNQKEIDISSLPDGIYILKVISGDEYGTGRFVKSK